MHLKLWLRSFAGFLAGCFAVNAKGSDDFFSFLGTFTWLNVAVYSEVLDSSLNPMNAVLQLPNRSLVSEFRPNLKFVHPSLQLVVRPRIHMNYDALQIGDKDKSKGYSHASISEAYLQWMLSETVYFAYGRQSYQWGPAESLSPSNKIFHETTLRQNGFYEVKGRNIARLNFTPTDWFNMVLMTEFEENKDEIPFQADTEFGTTTLIKLEANWDGGASYFGLVLGGREHARPWLGEYANILLPSLEGMSIYVDASQQKGSQAFYPKQRFITVLESDRTDEAKINSLIALGLRYDLENGSMVRGEYIFNEAGYSKEERQTVFKAIKSYEPLQLNFRQQLIERSLASGLELPGKRYVYFSLYIPDVWGMKDFSIAGRWLYSLTDYSSSSYLNLERGIGDQGTIFLANTVNRGQIDSELAGVISQAHILGYRHVW